MAGKAAPTADDSSADTTIRRTTAASAGDSGDAGSSTSRRVDITASRVRDKRRPSTDATVRSYDVHARSPKQLTDFTSIYLSTDDIAPRRDSHRLSWDCRKLAACSLIAKFHYTDPTGPARIRTDFFAAKLRWVRAGPVGSV